MTFLRIAIQLYLFCLSMTFSENRYPLFRIMRYRAATALASVGRLTSSDRNVVNVE